LARAGAGEKRRYSRICEADLSSGYQKLSKNIVAKVASKD
jgi:hypothetical protein